MYMLSARVRSESQNLRRIGQPTQSTTGVPSINSIQLRGRGMRPKGSVMPIMGDMASTTNGIDSATPTQKRRVRSRNSVSSSTAPPTGTRAMPHFGQSPGLSLTTSGCSAHSREESERHRRVPTVLLAELGPGFSFLGQGQALVCPDHRKHDQRKECRPLQQEAEHDQYESSILGATNQ